MTIAAWVFSILGGLGVVMGIITAAEVVPLLGAEFTAMFWLALSAVLLLVSIAAILARGYE